MSGTRDPEPQNVKDRLVTLGAVLTKEEDVMDRAFALGVGTRELFDTIRDPGKTAELYTTLGSTNIKVSAWKPLSKLITRMGAAMPLAQDKDEHIRLADKPFTVYQRLVQRYRADGSGVPYLVSSVEYLCLYDEDEPVPRLFVLFRISQTPTQQFGDIMQLHEYLTFYRRGRTVLDDDDDVVRERLARVNAASMRRTMVNYRPSIEYAGSKPVLHHLIKRIAIPSMRKAFSDWVAALGPLAARFAEELLAKARAIRAKEKAEAAARLERLAEAHADVADSDDEGGEATPGGAPDGEGPRGRDGGKRTEAASGAAASRASAASAAGAGSGAGSKGKDDGDSDADGAESGTDDRDGIRNVFMGSLSAAKKRAAQLKRRSGEKAKSGQDVRRLEDRAAAMREQREEETRKLRRLVHAHVNGEAVTLHAAESARLDAARGKLQGLTDDAAVGSRPDPAARAQKLRTDAKRAALEAMQAAERESDFGFLDSYSMAGDDVGGGGGGRLMLDGVDEGDLTGRFWAQTFTRDCSIWPGEMEGDDPAPVVDLFSLAFGTRADGSMSAAGGDGGDRLDAIAPPHGPADSSDADEDPKARGEAAEAADAAGSRERARRAAEAEAEASATEEAYRAKKRRLALEDPADRQAHLLELLVGGGAAAAIRSAPGVDALPPPRSVAPTAGSVAGSAAQSAPSWAAESKRDDEDRPGSAQSDEHHDSKPSPREPPPARQSVLMTVAGVDATPSSLADLLGSAPVADPADGVSPGSAASEGGFESDGGVDDFMPINGSVGGLSIPRQPKRAPAPPIDDVGTRSRPGRGECTPADMPCAVM